MDNDADRNLTNNSNARMGLEGSEGHGAFLPAASGFPTLRSAREEIGAVEWPTIVVGIAIYAGWLALTAWHAVVPEWALALGGGLLAGWHSSFQHELTHGHPTRNTAVNAVLAGPALLLWLPFGIFRREHLRHHANGQLTNPVDDPESFYVLERDWWAMNRLRRGLLLINNTLAGRLVIGPALVIVGFLWGEARRLARRDTTHAVDWTWHLLGLLPVIGWLSLVVEMPLWLYVICFSYPGTALLLLRSYHEHRPAFDLEHRTVIVEAGPLLSPLFLNNNLHAVHHGRPDLPW